MRSAFVFTEMRKLLSLRLILNRIRMFDVLYCLFVLLDLLSSRSDCVQIVQPPDLLVNLTDDVQISCKHDDNNLDVMLWYQRRRESTTLELVSYNFATGTPTYEPGYGTRFKHNRMDTLTGGLSISHLSQSDSGVYHCAARRHSASVSSPA
ncbi:T-cell receptor beta variable region [Clarias magur]|nr:T-cell receptor beta variable region [Clarias magur]